MFARKLHSGLFFLSLSNLFFLRSWSVLFDTVAPDKQYYLPYLPGWEPFAGLAAGILALAAALEAAYRLAARRSPAAAAATCHAAMLAVLPVTLFGLRNNFPILRIAFHGDHYGAWVYLLYGAAGCLLFAPAYLLRRRLAGAARVGILCLSPLAFWNLAKAGYHALESPAGTRSAQAPSGEPQGADPGGAGKGKLLWFIFDEADQGLIFDGRPEGLALPALDRLKAEAFSADSALPPADNTLMSIPSLLSGKLFRSARTSGPRTLEMIGPSGERTSWPDSGNLFQSLKAKGARLTLAGWYHPYCRLFGDLMARCGCRPNGELFTGSGLGFWMAKAFTHNLELHNFFLLREGGSLSFGNPHASNYRWLQASALEAMTDPSDFVYVHWPIPHRPFIHDPGSEDGESANSQAPADYPKNLLLMDKSLAAIRGRLESSGRWESTTLILSSDHWWRNAGSFRKQGDLRVPFLVRLPGQDGPFRYRRAFNTVATSGLILALHDGRIAGYRQVAEWLDANGKPSDPVLRGAVP